MRTEFSEKGGISVESPCPGDGWKPGFILTTVVAAGEAKTEPYRQTKNIAMTDAPRIDKARFLVWIIETVWRMKRWIRG